MRTVIQRVKQASVTIEGLKKAQIGEGLLIFLGIEEADNPADIEWLTKKISLLRIFNDSEGVMNKSVIDIDGSVLIISQFTLHASTKKGNRPFYIRAAKPENAIPLYDRFCAEMSLLIGKEVETGVFGADMKVELLNDGPVTIWIDSKNKE